MPQLVIDSIEYNVPTDFTLGKWSYLTQFSLDPINYIKIISSTLGLPISTTERIPFKTQELVATVIHTLLNQQEFKINKVVNGGQLIDFNSITLGQFIDLEVFITRSHTKHIKQICEVLYNTPIDDAVLLSDVYGGFMSYLNWRTLLYTQYKNLFNIGGDNEEQIEDTPHPKTDAAYAWFDVVMVLAEGKFLQVDAVLDKSVVSAFNWLAWNKTQKEKEAELNRLQHAQNKMR